MLFHIVEKSQLGPPQSRQLGY